MGSVTVPQFASAPYSLGSARALGCAKGVRLGPGAYDGFTDPLLRPDLAARDLVLAEPQVALAALEPDCSEKAV